MSLINEYCTSKPSRLAPEEIKSLLPEVPEWTLADNTLTRERHFPDFTAAITFVTQVADIVQAEDHHPEIHINYRTVRLTLTTHSAGGLTRNDFILAAKIDRIAI